MESDHPNIAYMADVIANETEKYIQEREFNRSRERIETYKKPIKLMRDGK
jgi:hypothetical protein